MIIRADADFRSNLMEFPETTMAKGLRIKRRKGHQCGVLEANIPSLSPWQHGNKAGRKDHKHT
jgi:hypothetical protein